MFYLQRNLPHITSSTASPNASNSVISSAVSLAGAFPSKTSPMEPTTWSSSMRPSCKPSGAIAFILGIMSPLSLFGFFQARCIRRKLRRLYDRISCFPQSTISSRFHAPPTIKLANDWQSLRDANCIPEQAFQLFATIRNFQPELPCRMVLYPDSGHSLLSKGPLPLAIQHRKDNLAWFQMHL